MCTIISNDLIELWSKPECPFTQCTKTFSTNRSTRQICCKITLLFPLCGVCLALVAAAPLLVLNCEAPQRLAVELSNWPIPPPPSLPPKTVPSAFPPGPPARAAPPYQSQTAAEQNAQWDLEHCLFKASGLLLTLRLQGNTKWQRHIGAKQNRN